MKTMKTKFKPMFFSYDWKESPGQVVEDLKPLLKKFGIHILLNPMSLGSDSYGYIVTDNPKMTIGEYRKLLGKEFSDSDEWLTSVKENCGLTDKDGLHKLIDALS